MKTIKNERIYTIEFIALIVTLFFLWFCFDMGKSYRTKANKDVRIEKNEK